MNEPLLHPAHDIVLPREFGRTLHYAIACCRRCNAEWDAYYTQKGVQRRPRNAAARSHCRPGNTTFGTTSDEAPIRV